MGARPSNTEETKARIAATLKARNSTPEGVAARQKQSERLRLTQAEIRQHLFELASDTAATGATAQRIADNQEDHNRNLEEALDNLADKIHQTQEYLTDTQDQIRQNQRDIDRLLTLVTLILTHLVPGQTTETATDAQGGDQAK